MRLLSLWAMLTLLLDPAISLVSDLEVQGKFQLLLRPFRLLRCTELARGTRPGRILVSA